MTCQHDCCRTTRRIDVVTDITAEYIFIRFYYNRKPKPLRNNASQAIRERKSRVYILFPTTTSRPLPDLSICSHRLVPTYRHLVPVRTVSRPAVMCFIPDFFRPAVRPVVPIPSRCSHTSSPIPQLTQVADVPIPFAMGCNFSPSCI